MPDPITKIVDQPDPNKLPLVQIVVWYRMIAWPLTDEDNHTENKSLAEWRNI
jgi:hypothetical protein